ncbi:carboxypeptidase-like regulatory domain-containing protein [Dyadobacter sp. CY261]|uniref:carboxypeptidase-like regulatory domain-containing protein n=1 Tax=Dyadobacter sp. CY261 TaxID=2907203 RepID=UPI001F3B253B|nr:carboxypeptidase-like regulatory domain-containing protein [Dyadobacter sp. CY261]MCF0075327.1 carboxypeptidase-like regulatory domain-containing protein [Dyadobacter sp. CY261]
MRTALLCLALIFANIFFTKAQDMTDVEFVIMDEESGQMIRKGEVSLKILYKNYGAGADHEFDNGTTSVKYPVNTTLIYTIVSDDYYLRRAQVMSLNVRKGEPNVVTIDLTSAEEKDIIIKGRVKRPDNYDLPGCRVQISMESSGMRETVTDSSGFFQFILKDSKNLIGTDFVLGLRHPSYAQFDSLCFLRKKQRIVSLNDLTIREKAKPVKTGHIKFYGSPKALGSILLRSEIFTISLAGIGYWKLVTNRDILPSVVKLKLDCRNCITDSLSINTSDLIGKTFEVDLRPRMSYPINALRVYGSGEFDIFSGPNMERRSSNSAKVGVARIFSVLGHWFEIDAAIDVWNSWFIERNKYLTLPGNEGAVSNFYFVKALPLLRARYFLRRPNGTRPSWYVGLNSAYYRQSFKSLTSDKEIDEDEHHSSFFGHGVNAGVRYNLNPRVSIYGEACVDYLKVSSINYQFNYFGRADEATYQQTRLKANFNISMSYNL